MHARVTLMTADPERLGGAVRYVENEARRVVEDRLGNRGMSAQMHADIGVAVVTSYWISGDAMRDSEHSVAATRAEALRRGAATVSVERFEVTSFLRLKPADAGAGVQLTRLEAAPADVDRLISSYEDVAIPWLTEAEGLCAAVLFVDRRSGRGIAETLWRDGKTLAANRGRAADIRADTVAATGSAVRALEEFDLVFNTARAV